MQIKKQPTLHDNY